MTKDLPPRPEGFEKFRNTNMGDIPPEMNPKN